MAAIVFAGTPEFAVPSLAALAAAGYEIPAVLTQPDRPSGRGQRLRAPPAKRKALELGIPVRAPVRLDADTLESLGAVPAVLVVVAYGLILPRSALEWPQIAAVNVHASLLPRWRGAAPVQRAIEAGDAETGVSIMRMDEGLDTGPVYLQRSIPLSQAATGGGLHDTLAGLGARALIEALPGILSGELTAVPQVGQATYAAKITKAEARLDWSESAAALERKIRAFDPWPGTESRLTDGRRLRVLKAAVSSAAAAREAAAGTILAASSAGIDVQTGRGVLRLLEIQAPSARRMAAGAWLAAHSLDGVSFAA